MLASLWLQGCRPRQQLQGVECGAILGIVQTWFRLPATSCIRTAPMDSMAMDGPLGWSRVEHRCLGVSACHVTAMHWANTGSAVSN